VIVMVWIYLGSLVLLIGAEINCELCKLRPVYSLRHPVAGAADPIPHSIPEQVPRANGPQA
jgi:uncharacterized BrkB/YihY/UPF0761 family membrane protein